MMLYNISQNFEFLVFQGITIRVFYKSNVLGILSMVVFTVEYNCVRNFLDTVNVSTWSIQLAQSYKYKIILKDINTPIIIHEFLTKNKDNSFTF